jgi:hypothetical protein
MCDGRATAELQIPSLPLRCNRMRSRQLGVLEMGKELTAAQRLLSHHGNGCFTKWCRLSFEHQVGVHRVIGRLRRNSTFSRPRPHPTRRERRFVVLYCAATLPLQETDGDGALLRPDTACNPSVTSGLAGVSVILAQRALRWRSRRELIETRQLRKKLDNHGCRGKRRAASSSRSAAT